VVIQLSAGRAKLIKTRKEHIMSKKKIVDAKADPKGNITHVKLKGNQTFTPLKTAIKLTKQGKVDAVVVKPKKGKEHLRTRPDKKEENNLDDMAGDK
jgi:Protein of unknown function (DUF3892)